MDFTTILGPVLLIVLGVALAFAGRRFISLVIGVAGFVLGYNLVVWIIPNRPGLAVIAGAVMGIIAGLLAIGFAELLLSIVGFILIGYACTVAARAFGIEMPSPPGFVIFFAGGAAGLLVVRLAFGLALVLVSALAGGALVMQGVSQLSGGGTVQAAGVLALIVAAAGAFAQLRGPCPRA